MEKEHYTDEQVWDFVRFWMRLAKAGRRSARAVLEQCPPCHFFALERLHMTILEHGQAGAICMGDLAGALHDSPQAASRTIRILEADGLAERAPDPADRRRTLVRLTALGEERRTICEEALREHIRAVWRRMGREHSDALLREARLLEEALAELEPSGAAPEGALHSPPSPTQKTEGC